MNDGCLFGNEHCFAHDSAGEPSGASVRGERKEIVRRHQARCRLHVFVSDERIHVFAAEEQLLNLLRCGVAADEPERIDGEHDFGDFARAEVEGFFQQFLFRSGECAVAGAGVDVGIELLVGERNRFAASENVKNPVADFFRAPDDGEENCTHEADGRGDDFRPRIAVDVREGHRGDFAEQQQNQNADDCGGRGCRNPGQSCAVDHRVVQHGNAAVDEHVRENDGNERAVVVVQKKINSPLCGGGIILVSRDLCASEREKRHFAAGEKCGACDQHDQQKNLQNQK